MFKIFRKNKNSENLDYNFFRERRNWGAVILNILIIMAIGAAVYGFSRLQDNGRLANLFSGGKPSPGKALSSEDYFSDLDNDELVNGLEEIFGTDPRSADSDGDGYSDGEEISNGYNPLGEGDLPAGEKEEAIKKYAETSIQKYLSTAPGSSQNKIDCSVVEPEAHYGQWGNDPLDHCYFMKALSERNPAYCNKIAISAERYDCFSALSEKTEDPKLCAKLPGGSGNGFPSDRDNCYLNIAKDGNNAEYCGKIVDVDTRNSCYEEVAINISDPELCKKIADQNGGYNRSNYGYDCFTKLAVKSGNYNLCDNIVNRNYAVSNGVKDYLWNNEQLACYAEVGGALENLKVCDLLYGVYLHYHEMEAAKHSAYSVGTWKPGEYWDCVKNVAVKKGDKTICDNLPEDGMMDKDRKTQCYNEIFEAAEK